LPQEIKQQEKIKPVESDKKISTAETEQIVEKGLETKPANNTVKREKVIAEIQDGMKVCPQCNSVQRIDRKVCCDCGVIFIDESAPYWCGNCGYAGPYEGKCPSCNSSLKKYNTKK
jgi:ribosomal protein S27AE